MTKTLNDFYNNLGARESGGNYSSVNKYGYVGKYQMGEAAMIDAGYYKSLLGNTIMIGLVNLQAKMVYIVFKIF